MRTIVLRPAQVDALRGATSERFVGRLEAHLREFFPDACGRLDGPKGLREVVRHGMARAAEHGLRSQREVCKYLDLMFAFGRDFDRDPRLGWAVPVFEGHSHDLSRSKVDRLFELALQHPEQAHGLEADPSPSAHSGGSQP